jgi:ABC-type amino acid transport substrate-binding protein
MNTLLRFLFTSLALTAAASAWPQTNFTANSAEKANPLIFATSDEPAAYTHSLAARGVVIAIDVKTIAMVAARLAAGPTPSSTAPTGWNTSIRRLSGFAVDGLVLSDRRQARTALLAGRTFATAHTVARTGWNVRLAVVW